MFQTLALNRANQHAAARHVLESHPLVISALIEEYWNRNPAAVASPFTAWPAAMNDRIFDDFQVNVNLPARVRWEHLVYAFLLEKTGIFR